MLGAMWRNLTIFLFVCRLLLGGGLGEATDLAEKLRDEAANGVMSFDDLVGVATKLSAVFKNGNDIESWTQRFHNLTAGTGVELDRLVSQFVKAKASGVFNASFFDAFSAKGINLYEPLKEQTGKSEEELRKLAAEGKLAFSEVEAALVSLTSATGRFVFANPAASHIAGFHWNALATMDWADLARQYLAAKAAADKGDISDLTVFYQKRLAEAWKDDSDDQELVSQMVPAGEYSFGDPWSEEGKFDLRRACAVPAGAEGTEKFPPLRFMTVDVQEGYFYFVVRAWSAGGSSRLIDCGMLQFFDEVAARAKQHNVLPVFTFLDCGFNADQVFRFCAETGFTALRGTGKNEWQFRGGAKRYYSPRELVACGNGKFARRHYFSNLRCKDILAVLRSGRASATWEIPRDAPVNYLKMLNSERRDNLKQVWEQIGQRPNHYFDCEVMNVCAALMLNLVGLKPDCGSH